MGWLPVVSQLLSFSFDFADGWQERQKAAAVHKHEVRMAAMANAKEDWKDEVVLFLVAYPIVSAFVPFTQDNTAQAIKVIAGYPSWMTGLFVSICMAVYGVQKLTKAKR